LGGCAAKPTAGSAQAVSAPDDKDAAACLEQPLKKQSYAEHQKSFASCMSAKGYHDDKLYRNPLISDGSKNIARESSPELAANEHYERAIADYNNCVLEHTSNLSACAKLQAIMNDLGKVSSRVSLSQSYQTTLPPRTPQTPQATPSQTPAPVPPQTTYHPEIVLYRSSSKDLLTKDEGDGLRRISLSCRSSCVDGDTRTGSDVRF